MVILQLEEQPPLIQAIFSGEVDAVRKLLESKQDVNYQDFEKRSALHAAAFRGDPIITKLLIDHGARVNTKDCKWVTPLHRACYSGSEETVTILLNNSADTCARDRLWQTPLHIAAACNSLECVSYLLDRIQNPNVTDRSGRTALHHAVLNGHNDIVELLIARGCIVNACDKKDCRPMHWAAYKGHIETVEILLQHGADINAKDRNQYTPLHVAAASGAVAVIDVLVENGADIEAQNAYGNTPLHVACLNGHGNLAAELVRYRCDKEATNYKGQTPLHLAAASTHGVHCLNLLVSQNVDINRQSLDGRTPLHMTAIHGRFTRSKTLIDKGATVDCVDRNGCTALHIAAHYGHELLSNTLLSYGAQPARKGFEGRTPLHMCCLSGYIECCRIFIKAGVDLNDKDDTGKTPLHCAAYKGAVECVDLLVSSGADFRITDVVGRTALHYASAQGFFFCVFTLVGIGSPVNQADKDGRTALHLAAAYDIDGRCVNYLIEHKADPKVKDSNGFTPIHYAVAGNNVNALKYLLYAVGNCALSGPDMPLTTPLHIAARNGNTEMLEKLMPYLSDPNVRNEHGCTPLLMAARHGYASCVQMLLRFGAKVSICDIPNGLSPVHHSAKNGHVHCLALLVDNAEDKGIIDLPDNLRRTALMLAVSNSHTDCVTTLIKSGADPNVVDGDGHTCLFRAVVTGQHNILQMLLPRSTIVNERDIHGKTALHVAAGCGRLSCVQRILPYMDEQVKESTDQQDCTALHWACYSGSAECVAHFFNENIFKKMNGNAFSPVHCAASIGAEKCLELLCAQYGPEIVKLKDDKARTPLHVAALHGQCDCARFLLDQGADVNRQDQDGKTPLISAAFNGQVQVIEILIGNKADVAISDKNGNTALHIACLRRHSNAALLLLEFVTTPEVINMTNNERKTALHLTARNGLVDVTRRLIAKGSSVTAVDASGLTPALCCAPNANVAQCLAIILASHSAQNTAVDGKDSFPACLALNYLKADARTSTSTLKSGENRTLQTDITMLRDPDQFELERMFEIKFRKTDAADLSPSSSSEDDDGSRFFIHYRSQDDVSDPGRADTAEQPCRASALELHGSHSDTALTPKPIYSEEDYEKMIKQTAHHGDYLSGDASRQLLKAARRKCNRSGKDDSQHQHRITKFKTAEQRRLAENFKSKSAASVLTTFRSDDSTDVVLGYRDLDADKDIVEANLPKKKAIHGGGGGVTPRMNRSPKYTNKRLKQPTIATTAADNDSDTNRCHVCRQSLGSAENDEHNIPLETMQTAIEKVLAQKGCSTNRCLLAFLDESYELNAKNAHYIYHGMLHPKCEPYIAKHLNLSESDVEIVENVAEEGGYIIRKQQHRTKQHGFKSSGSNRGRYDQNLKVHRSDKNKLYAGGKQQHYQNQQQQQQQQNNQNTNSGLNIKVGNDARCKLAKEDSNKLMNGDGKSKTIPSQFHGGRKLKERRLSGAANSQKGAKYSVVTILPTKSSELNQIQKVQSEKAYASKIKKNRNFSCSDVQQLTETETIEDPVETGCGEKTNVEYAKGKESFFPDYLKPFTNFHHLDPLTTIANEEIGQGGCGVGTGTAGHMRCYSTYWCFPEVTETSSSKETVESKSSKKQSPSTSMSSPTPTTNPSQSSAYKIKSEGTLKRDKSTMEFVGAPTVGAGKDHEMLFFNEKLAVEGGSADVRSTSELSLTTLGGASSAVIDVDDEIEELERLRRLDESQPSKYDGGDDDDDGGNEAADAGWDEVRSLERRGGVTDIKSYSSVDEEAEDWREDLEQFFTNSRRQQLLSRDVAEAEKIDVEDWKRFSARNFEPKLVGVRCEAQVDEEKVDDARPPTDLNAGIDTEIKSVDKIEVHYDNHVVSSTISSEYDIEKRGSEVVSSISEIDNPSIAVADKGEEIAIEEPLDDVSMFNDIPTMDAEEHLVKNTILNEHTESFLEKVQLQKKRDPADGVATMASNSDVFPINTDDLLFLSYLNGSDDNLPFRLVNLSISNSVGNLYSKGNTGEDAASHHSSDNEFY